MYSVPAPHGRGKLIAEEWGSPKGTPVFLIHGTPGSRNGPRPRGSLLYRLGIRLIGYDRPGYGDSTRRPDRIVADAADDVRAIADFLKIDRFSVVGRSGGGPHALACAALLPGRVVRAAALVSLAPSDAKDLEWYSGMVGSNVQEYSQADVDQDGVVDSIVRRASAIRDDPEQLLKMLQAELAGPDLRVVGDVAIRRLLISTYREALRTGAYGWVDDVLAFRRPWGFDLGRIDAQTLLWHGADDRFSPVGHTLWLAAHIPHAEMHVEPGASHFSAVEILPDVLVWMSRGRYEPRVLASPGREPHAGGRADGWSPIGGHPYRPSEGLRVHGAHQAPAVADRVDVRMGLAE